MIWVMAMFLACGDKIEVGDDTGSEGLNPMRYPSGDEILVYTGHGGVDGDGGASGEVEIVSARWQSTLGYQTNVRDVIPTDLSDYRAIIMMAPGYHESENFSASDVKQLRAALANGTRLIILADNQTCSEASVSNLLGLLDVTVRFDGFASTAANLVQVETFNYESQVVEGLTEVLLHAPCYATDGDAGEMFFADKDNNVVGVRQQFGGGGDVVLIGDYRFLDDTGYLDYVDNALLADNLVIVQPSDQ